MIDDTITLGLNGDVALSDFSSGMQHFAALVSALSEEVAADAEIEWVIDSLDAGSARATVRGVCDDADAVERVVASYGNIGKAVETGSPIPYSQNVVRKVNELASVINGRVTSLQLVTKAVDVLIASREISETAPQKPRYSYGAISGTVESITRRRGLKFMLYNEVFDQAITCHVSEELKEEMRSIWGKRVTVSGRIRRDPMRGSPVSVTEITSIRTLPDKEPGLWRRAIGILPLAPNAERPEVIIRRLRDA